jgi:hypothetical protein
MIAAIRHRPGFSRQQFIELLKREEVRSGPESSDARTRRARYFVRMSMREKYTLLITESFSKGEMSQ